MHRYFVIPMVVFFSIISGFEIYMQFINEDWKYLAPKPVLPESCNDNSNVKLILHDKDKIENRSFHDKPDIIKGNQLHAIFLLPCEREDRQYDVNLNIEQSLFAINKWFLEKSNKQEIKFDRNHENKIDVTFLRVNKTMLWFDDNVNEDNKQRIDISSKIKEIIFANKNIFNNFDDKKFIIFFEGWERKKHLNFNICGKATFNGNIAIYYTFSRFKKYIGNDLILKNNKKIFSCNNEDHLNNFDDEIFGDAEATILHEILHTLGAPAKCANNFNSYTNHVLDNENDILHNQSGNNFLDYNNDDYYDHKIKNCPDLKDSNYLIKVKNL